MFCYCFDIRPSTSDDDGSSKADRIYIHPLLLRLDKMTTYLLTSATWIDNPVALNGAFGEDSVIVFKSPVFHNKGSITSANNSDNTSINFLSDSGSVLLHISLRVAQNAIVLNTRPHGGGWGPEERLTLSTSFTSPEPMITVYNRGRDFKITLGSAVHYYKRRINELATKLAYGINAGQNIPIFSNPLPANVIKMDHLLETLAPISTNNVRAVDFS